MSGSHRFNLRLGVIGHIPHWVGPGEVVMAYEPYVREMRIWAELFSEVVVCSPRGDGPAKGNLAPYRCANLRWDPVNYCVELGRAAARRRVKQLPGLIVRVSKIVRDSDFVLLRSPGHLGLVGSVMVALFGKRSLTKWAGENGTYVGERLVPRLDRLWHQLPRKGQPVLVYGPPKRSHQVTFIPALMTDEELDNAQRAATARRWEPPWRLICVGRLVPEKGFDLALRGLDVLRRTTPQVPWCLTLVGDGPARAHLESLSSELGLAGKVVFTGALGFEKTSGEYSRAHIAIMPGILEGWPKIIAESWAHGVLPVAAIGGIVPAIVGHGETGALFYPSPESLAEVLSAVMLDERRWAKVAERGPVKAQALSLSQFRAGLEKVLVERCGLQ